MKPASINVCVGTTLFRKSVSSSPSKIVKITDVAVPSYLPVSLEVVWRRDPLTPLPKTMMDSKVQVCLSTEDNRGVFMVVGMVGVDALTANIPWHSTCLILITAGS